jgi:polyisoprenoid-binding protein YceI
MNNRPKPDVKDKEEDMQTVLKSRGWIWAIAIAFGIAMAITRPSPTVAAVRIVEQVGKPAVRYKLAADGNEARYRVREELAGVDFPNDAIGKTTAITGGISFDDKGKIVRDSSRFVIDLTTLASDKPRRDNFIKSNTLETDTYPTATFIPFEIRGLPSKLPTTGAVTFQITGDLVLHGVTRFTIWNVTAQAGAAQYSGTAKTSFVFDDFRMEQPNVPVVLSVNDTIKLEYDFKLVKSGS